MPDAAAPDNAARELWTGADSALGVSTGGGRQDGWPGAQNARSAGCAGDVGGHDVGGVPVQGDSGPVVAHGGARVGVGGRLLHVA